MATTKPLRVSIPDPDHYRTLISCQDACPVHTDARGYVRAIADGRFEEAYLIARGPNPFASICGRVCGAPCEAACRRGRIPLTDETGKYLGPDWPISIRALKRSACERAGVEARPPAHVLNALRDQSPRVCADAEEMAVLLKGMAKGRFEPAKGERVAIIGAGPAGLTAAHDLALLGLRPVVYELEPIAAGMLIFGVPEYRLPRDLIENEIAVIEALGVEIRCNVKVGRDVTFAELRSDHAAVIIAVGAKQSRALGLPGESGPGVFGGVDFLRTVALDEPLAVGQRIVVIGGGNVAFDVARTVVRQAAYDAARTAARLPNTKETILASLETLEEMPADTEEIREGDAEGVQRLSGWGPVEIRRDDAGKVKSVEFKRCKSVYDDQRRFSPVFDEEDRRVIVCDTVMLAVGQATDLSLLDDGGEDVELMRPGWPKVDPDTLATTAPGVFVAGDLAHGTRLIIDAVASGKHAARSVYAHVTGRTLDVEVTEHLVPVDPWDREKGYEAIRRVEIPSLPAADRLLDTGASVEIGYSQAEARQEASRCLDCGVTPVFDGTRCVLCGGCADVCPTLCLKLVTLDQLANDSDNGDDLAEAIRQTLGPDADLTDHSAILKDEDRCIRCAQCEMRCPVEAITMERVTFQATWRKG